ncbi:MAG: choice-of-anchor J domain-containing protein [Verrucomicrobia bacterium]|nr:choice-of-anchor J domain-containing protein [Verrucomicrobiota bacterium]
MKLFRTPLPLSLVATALLFSLVDAPAASRRILPPVGPIEAAALQTSDEAVAATRGITVAQLRRLCELRETTRAEVLVMPSAKLERAIKKTAVDAKQPGYPEEYIRWRESFFQDEKGVIDSGRMQAAREAAKRMPLNPRLLPAARKNASGEVEALVSPMDWTWRGPGNIGGRTRALVIHPTQTNRLWLGSVGGGLWYSSDSGASWNPVNDFMANLAITSLVMDPNNPDIMYASTGEGFFNVDAIRGAGIFKSTDAGVTWSQLSATNTSNFYYTNRIAISPNGATLLAATSTGLFRSTDAGVTWNQVQATASRMTQVVFDPNDSTKAVGVGYGSLAFYSTDSGATWTAATGLPAPGTGSLPGRSEVAYAKSVAGTIYNGFWNNGTASLYKSTNGGQTYTQVTVTGSTNWMSAQGWYDNTIWVDPTNANTLFVGGLDLYRSTNGGTNFTKISTWQSAPASAHADHHGIFPDPGYNGTTNRRVYFTNDGGIYKAENALTVAGTTGWTELNNNLGITQFYGAAGNPTTLTVVAGAQDNGSLRGLAGNTEGWTSFNGGDGGYCAADQNDPNYFYGEYVYATVARSTNGGGSATDIWSGISDANVATGAEFIAPFILDPNDQARMFVGGKSLWRSNNVKATTPAWTNVKASIGTANTDNITAIAVAPGNPDIIYVGHRNGNVYKTTNGTAASPTWAQVDTNGVGLPNRRVGRIVVDPTNVQRVYVCFGGYADPNNFGATNLWRSNDGAATWASVTSNLPLMPIYGLVVRPDNANVLYAATDVGVFGSEDQGATWSATNVGPANVSTSEIFFMAQYLVVCTHGRGVFQAPVLPETIPPTLSISPTQTVTNVSPITFRFTFSENVTGFDISDITVTGGTAGTLTGSGSKYQLQVTPTLPNNPVTVSVAAGAVTDSSGNALAGGSSATATFSTTSPFLYATAADGAAAPTDWQLGSGWFFGSSAAGAGRPTGDHTSGTGKLFANALSGNYTDGLNAYLTSPIHDLPAGRGYKLRFWMWLRAEKDTTAWDGGNVEISVNGGSFTLVPSASLSVPYTDTSVTALGAPGWSGLTLGAWTRVRMDLSAYAGQSVQFRFRFASDTSVTETGWFIDDFAIEQDPVLTLAATVPIANEGGANGQFTIALNPAAPEARTINYTTGGTAVAGTSYVTLSGTASAAAGATSVTIPVQAINDGSNALRAESVTVTLGTGVDYSLGAATNAMVVIVGSGGYDQWRSTRFSASDLLNAGISGPNGTPAGDGITNLMKYALGLTPGVDGSASLPRTEYVNVLGNVYQQIRVVVPSNVAATYAGEVSPDLLTAFSSAPADVEVITQPDTPSVGQTTRIFRDRTPVTTNKRFIRLRVTLN